MSIAPPRRVGRFDGKKGERYGLLGHPHSLVSKLYALETSADPKIRHAISSPHMFLKHVKLAWVVYKISVTNNRSVKGRKKTHRLTRKDYK
jgi:hypothetical protein